MGDKSIKSDVLISVLGHILLLLILTVSAHFSKPMAVFENTGKQDVISAVVLGDTPDSKIVPQQIAQAAPPVEKPKIVQKLPPPVAAKPQPVAEKKDVIALEKPKKKEKIKKDTKVADDIAKGLLADIKNQKQQIKKAKLVETRKEKRKNQKDLATKFQKELQLQAERTLRQQLLEDDIRIKGERVRQAQGEVNKYKALIIQSISENWIVPTQSDRKLYSELMIRLSPGGMVLDVQITRSSGDPALDSSARAAVLKASPLPVPKDPEAFRAFKQFVLKVKPENVT